MTDDKIKEVKGRLRKRFCIYRDEGCSSSSSTKRSREDIEQELLYEGLRNIEVKYLIAAAKELGNEK